VEGGAVTRRCVICKCAIEDSDRYTFQLGVEPELNAWFHTRCFETAKVTHRGIDVKSIPEGQA
jgi:hypothetical protein